MTKPAIVCVDDETSVLKSLKEELKNIFGNDYKIEIAEGGEEALELVAELLDDQCEIPLIISDYIMPDIKGDELLRRVHQLSPKTLKVMLTGQATIEGVANAIKYAKLYRYLAKPWQQEDLKLTVTEALNSYIQEKKIADQNAQLQLANQQLAALNSQQAELIAELNKAERKYRGIFENALEGIFQTTSDGRYISANRALAQIYGYDSPEELMASLTNIDRLYVEPHCRTEFIKLMQLDGEVSDFESRVYRKDGSIIWISESARTICDAGGVVSYYQGFVEDITSRKQAETEREKFTEELFQLNQAFSRFVPRQFLQFLDKNSIVDVQLGDQVQQEMSVLFSDIRDFTALSESMTPQDNFKFINAYLKRMEPAIVEHQGFIDKYIGDAIMALFGRSADDAVKAGITMLQRLADYNQYRVKSGYIPIKIGIGINTGSLMLGTVGGPNRMDSTVISDAVNLASRIENLTKDFEVPMLITHQTFLQLNEPLYAMRPIARVKVKGKSALVTVYEVFETDLSESRECKLATFPIFLEALYNYNLGKFREAELLFADCLRHNPVDRVAQIYLQQCKLPYLV
jgi:adenylate cyclase